MSTLTRSNAVFMRVQGRQCGPLTQDQVKALVRQGTALPADMVSMDGGQSWVPLGKTSLIKYMPLKRVQGRLQPPIMPDHIDLSFTAEVMALPAPPPSVVPPARMPADAPLPQTAQQTSKKAPVALVGGICLAVGALAGFFAGRLSGAPDAVPAVAEAAAAPVLALAEVDRSRSGQVVTIIGELGAVEERAEPAQLPGFAARCVLVRIRQGGGSLLAAIPWRASQDAKPGTVFVGMSDTGVLESPGLAKLTDSSGVPVSKGASVCITGKVRFKITDVPMVFPILEVTQIRLAQPSAQTNNVTP